jgi:hypothetical protein
MAKSSQDDKKVVPLKDKDLTKEYYKLKQGKRWIPKFGWSISEGEVKRIPKEELTKTSVKKLYALVHNYVNEDDLENTSSSKKGKKRVNVDVGEIEDSYVSGGATKPSGDIFKRYDIDVEKLLNGDSDEEIKIKKFNIQPVEIQTLICNETGKSFDSREGFLRHKLLLFENSKR